MRCKMKSAIGLLTVCMMVLVMIPGLCGVSSAYGADAIQFVEKTQQITNANGSESYSYTFAADETNKLDLKVENDYYSGSTSGLKFKADIVDSAGVVIGSLESTGSGLAELSIAQFPKADTYKMILYSGQNHMGHSVYEICFNLTDIQVATNKHESITAEVGNYTEGSVYEYAKYYVKLNVGKYNGTGLFEQAIYRENLKTGLFYATDTSDVVWDDAVAEGADYRYYVVNKALLDYAGEMPTAYTEKAISAAAKEELTNKAVYTDVEMPDPKVQQVSDLKVKSKGIKVATVEWWWKADGQPGHVSSYELRVYNSKGKQVGKPVYAADGRVGTTLTIPYEGESQITVTPFYNYDNNTFWGEAKAVPVKSAKMKAPSINVTKISNSKVKITTYRDPAELGVQIQQKVGNKWKVVTNKGTAKVYKKTWSKNKAGSTQYRVRAYLKDAGKTYYSPWKKMKPQKNEFKYTAHSLQYYRNLYGRDTYWEPVKVYYSGNKIKLNCKFYNAWRWIDSSCKVKVTFKEGSKVVGTKTISSGTMAASTIKNMTVTLDKSKAGADLRTITYSVKYLKR
ncbi:MAG: hypothetical protein IKJ77_02460 [Firmicutes bacterium]|nr:hypothetical protein [Bacillota bacterium]